LKSIKHASFYDKDPIDNKFLANPQWKTHQTHKWLAKRDFIAKKGKHEQSWKPTKNHDGFKNLDPFENGLEVMGDISKKRDKRLETCKTEFSSIIPADQWQYRTFVTTSIRSQKGVMAAMDN
jgi:hypothetical protein